MVNITSGSQGVQNTYFNHTWLFRKSGSNVPLLAFANDLKGERFEGCKFKARLSEEIIVTIFESNFYFYRP